MTWPQHNECTVALCLSTAQGIVYIVTSVANLREGADMFKTKATDLQENTERPPGKVSINLYGQRLRYY